jgi:ribosomal protein S18 acetylase RimI-like enzyme
VNFAPERIELQSAALRMAYHAVPWDSEIFGFPVGQIAELELRDGDPTADFERFEAWCRDTSTRLVCCRLPHGRLREAGWLESRRFRFIEMIYRPRLDALQAWRASAGAVVVSQATAADLPSIEAIAASAFTTGRFLLDPRLDPGLSGKRYRQWVRNSFDDPRHQVLKAEVDGALVGFFVVEERADTTAYWHLTAIAPLQQGRGLGKAVWQAMLERHRRAGLLAVETTVSAHNLPVLSLYGRLGFRYAAAEMTFHRTDLA